MPANPEPLFEATDSRRYYYRRRLSARDLLPAVAIGVGVGLAAFYVARVLAQRTPLQVPETKRAKGVQRRRPAG